MRVDQSRHQRRAREVDRRRTTRRADLSARSRGNDLVAGDEHRPAGMRRVLDAVPHAVGNEQRGRRRRGRSGSRLARSNRWDRGDSCDDQCERAHAYACGFVQETILRLFGTGVEVAVKYGCAHWTRDYYEPEDSGRGKLMVVPTPSSLSAQIWPPCASIIPQAIESPRPAPFAVVSRARQNRSNTCGRSEGLMATPVSITDAITSSAFWPRRTRTAPSAGVNFMALPIRLERT